MEVPLQKGLNVKAFRYTGGEVNNGVINRYARADNRAKCGTTPGKKWHDDQSSSAIAADAVA